MGLKRFSKILDLQLLLGKHVHDIIYICFLSGMVSINLKMQIVY